MMLTTWPVEISEQEGRVLTVLREHRGRQQAIGQRDLSEATGIHTRTVRDLIKHLIEEHGEPIGSASSPPAGYYLITSDVELETAQQEFKTRIVEMAKRLAQLRKNAPADVLKQLALELS